MEINQKSAKRKRLIPPLKKRFLKITAEVFHSLKTLKRILHQTPPPKKEKKESLKKESLKKKNSKKKALKNFKKL